MSLKSTVLEGFEIDTKRANMVVCQWCTNPCAPQNQQAHQLKCSNFILKQKKGTQLLKRKRQLVTA